MCGSTAIVLTTSSDLAVAKRIKTRSSSASGDNSMKTQSVLSFLELMLVHACVCVCQPCCSPMSLAPPSSSLLSILFPFSSCASLSAVSSVCSVHDLVSMLKMLILYHLRFHRHREKFKPQLNETNKRKKQATNRKSERRFSRCRVFLCP